MDDVTPTGAQRAAQRCPGYHRGWAATRAADGRTCATCGGLMAPVPERRCDCEPTVHADGSVTHDDTCALYPWCPHEAGAFTCGMPCGCGCNGCAALSRGHAAFNAARQTPAGTPGQ